MQVHLTFLQRFLKQPSQQCYTMQYNTLTTRLFRRLKHKQWQTTLMPAKSDLLPSSTTKRVSFSMHPVVYGWCPCPLNRQQRLASQQHHEEGKVSCCFSVWLTL